MKYLLSLVSILLMFVSCNNDEPSKLTGPADRTVIVYMAAENNLSTPFAEIDTTEMIAGSKKLTDSQNYIVFVDKAEKARPTIWKFEKGQRKLLKEFQEDFYSSDPAKMKEILESIAKDYPAKSYGLVLWGHATGWIIENDTVEYTTKGGSVRRAYGRDTGNNSSRADNVGKWLNIPSLAKMLKSLSFRFDYIFCDCCNMANAETAYELRNVTDYLIASPAEIPAEGAPYDQITAPLFASGISAYKDIINLYADQTGSCLPLSVIKLSEMDQLANATKIILQTLEPTAEKELDLTGLMYYDGVRVKNLCSLYDMNDFLLQNAAADDYNQWKQAFDKAIVYKRFASSWITNGHINFSYFQANEQKYGGMSMYIPRTFYDRYDYSRNYNSTYHQMQWYWTIGWNNYGW